MVISEIMGGEIKTPGREPRTKSFDFFFWPPKVSNRQPVTGNVEASEHLFELEPMSQSWL